jgi:hypothetical protein
LRFHVEIHEDLNIAPDNAPEIAQEPKDGELTPEELDDVPGGKNEINRGPG